MVETKFRGKIKNKPCIYCGSIGDGTRDHVPPKVLFNKPLPKNMLTVPSCRKCNDSFSRDDQYFRDMLVNCEAVFFNPNAHAAKEKFWRSLVKPEAQGYRRFLVSKFSKNVELVTPSGIHLGRRPAVEIDNKRIDRVSNRIAKAIFYEIHQYPIPPTHKVRVRYNDAFLSIPKKFLDCVGHVWQPFFTIGGDIFSYTYANAIDEPDSMVFLYLFYGKLCFYGLVMPLEKSQRILPPSLEGSK